MAFFELSDGGRVRYEIIGRGEPVILTGGAWTSLDVLWPLAHELSRSFEVVLWDRRNTGRSDICFDGPNESGMWADDLHQLVVGLGRAPLHVLGGSGGSRLALMTAIRHPEVVRRMCLWNAVGGWFARAILAGTAYVPYILAAYEGGMEAVAKVPAMAERIAVNPRNRELLLAWEPDAFIARMKEWTEVYVPTGGSMLTGMTEDQLRAITAPTLIFAGGDDAHPPEMSDLFHALIPDTRLIQPARWDSKDYWSLRKRGENFSVWRELAPEIVAFLGEGRA